METVGSCVMSATSRLRLLHQIWIGVSMAKAARRAFKRRDQRRAQFDAIPTLKKGGFHRPGSMKKKAKSAANNRGSGGVKRR